MLFNKLGLLLGGLSLVVANPISHAAVEPKLFGELSERQEALTQNLALQLTFWIGQELVGANINALYNTATGSFSSPNARLTVSGSSANAESVVVRVQLCSDSASGNERLSGERYETVGLSNEVLSTGRRVIPVSDWIATDYSSGGATTAQTAFLEISGASTDGVKADEGVTGGRGAC